MLTPRSRLGYHYYPDDRHFTQADLETWLPVLDSLGAQWLTLRASPERAIPEPFVRGLVGAGIQPVVHVPLSIARLVESNLATLFTCYAQWGIQHVVVFDRPNLRASWDPSNWGRSGLVERFLDVMLPVLHAQRSSGLRPVLPPLEPGGDYWDTAFHGSLLEALARRGQSNLQAELTLAIYAWTFDRPLNWGAGGASRWPEARPYHTPEGCQDQRGLRAFDWYRSVAETSGLAHLPMLVIAGGALPNAADPAIGADSHTEQNLAIARALQSEDIPPSLLNFAFYPLATDPDHTDHGAAWFPTLEAPRPVVAAFRRLAELAPKNAVSATEKPIKHYLLLPSGTGASFIQEWEKLAEFTAAHHPATGFSLEEARLAQQVTLAGDEESISPEVEYALRASGCRVQRLTRGADSRTDSSPVAEGCRAAFAEAGV
jgi:hypothetical protein